MEVDVPTGCALVVGVDVVGAARDDCTFVETVVVPELSRFDDWALEQPAAVNAMLTLATIRSAVGRMALPYGKRGPNDH